MKICPSCGFIDEEDSLYCEKCGSQMIDYKEESDTESEDNIPQEESHEQDSVTESAEEMPKFCPNCGQAISEDSLFCENCGTRLDESYAEEQNSEKKKPSLKLIIPAVAVVVVIIGVLGVLFLGKTGKNKAGTFAVYVRDNELEYSSLKKKAEPMELTSRLFDSEAYDYSNLDYQVRLTEDGSRMFYPDKKEVEEFVLYYRDLGKNKAESVRVDSGISGYSINPDGTKVAYVKGSYPDFTLYLYDLKTDEKEKIVSEVINYRISKEFTQIWFTDEDNTLYTIKPGDKKEKIDKDVRSFYVLDDEKTIYYLKDNGNLYKYTPEKDKEMIAKDVVSFGAINRKTGTMYYDCTSDNNWEDLVADDMKSADAMMKEPVEPEYPSWGTVDYDRKIEQYEKDMTTYYDEYEKYSQKLDRDRLREQAKNYPYPLTKLYYFDGKTSEMVSDDVLNFNTPMLIEEGYVIGFERFIKGNRKLTYEDVVNGTWWTDDSIELCALQGPTVEALDIAGQYGRDVSGNNTLYYFDDYDEEKQCGELYKITITNGKFTKPEFVDDEVSHPIVLDGNLLYYKDYKVYRDKDYRGDLYFNGEYVDTDVNRINYDENADTLYYVTDYDYDDYLGTLYRYHDGKKEKISDDVNDFCYSTVEDGVLYLYDYSTKHGTGELRYKKNGKEEKIDDDVNIIIKPVIERKE